MARRGWFGLLGIGIALGLVLPGAAVALPAAAVALPRAAAPGCEQMWGSLPKSVDGMTSAPITNVRAGEQPCTDRLVVDIADVASGFDVRYVDQVTMDGSGAPVPLRGGAKLHVTVRAPAYDANGNSTYHPANPRELVNVTGYSTFRQVAFAGSFEGVTTVGLGVRARLPFTVYVLPGPGSNSRIVVDVAHQW